jgi:1-acyl-sn-glycerol-3-phosphate acyltransferase
MLTSLILLIVLPPYILLGAMFGIPYAALTGKVSILYWLGRQGVRLGFAIARIRIRVQGWDDRPQRPHFIYIMNHSSNLDVPAVFLHLPGDVRVLGKKELFKLPVLGTVMKMGGFVPVDRSNREAAIASVTRAAEVAREGASFLIAPEGTRSRTGKLLPFKKGAFRMAIQSGVPIQPITVRGVFELMPPGSFAIRSGTIDIIFHEPVATAGLRIEHRSELVEEVRNRIASALEDDSQVRT